MAGYVTVFLLLALQAGLGLTACPNITLPWGIYRSSWSVSNGTTCVYSNVRFGKKPVRFQRPNPPDKVAVPALQPTQASACYQFRPDVSCPTTSAMVAAPTIKDGDPPRFGAPLPGGDDEDSMSEDCLFADLYVPASALAKPNANLPVVIWLYGGAYIFGSKNFGDTPFYDMPFYSGEGLLTHQDMIFVTGNYRMGAFGWLAGPTMVQKATANAGLWDQRLLIQFVQDHISSFGGNPNHVSLWGESAGAGSIMYHLTSAPPPPKIKTALLQSPAYLWQWNPMSSGYANQIYNEVARVCGCGSGAAAFACLQNLSVDKLQACNGRVITTVWNSTGLAPFNPAIDGGLITDLPAVSLYNGKFAPVESLLISHVFDESISFTPCWITSTAAFERFLAEFMPGPLYESQRRAILRQYPPGHYPGKDGPFRRAHDVIQDSSFICNTRFMFDAYYNTKPSTPLYMMSYGFGASQGIAVHASDLLPTFWNGDITFENFFNFINDTIKPGISREDARLAFWLESALSQSYQPYVATFGTGGRPKPDGTWPQWSTAKPGPGLGANLTSVMDLHIAAWNNSYVDTQNSNLTCWFWKNMSYWVQATAKAQDRPVHLIQDENKNELK